MFYCLMELAQEGVITGEEEEQEQADKFVKQWQNNKQHLPSSPPAIQSTVCTNTLISTETLVTKETK